MVTIKFFSYSVTGQDVQTEGSHTSQWPLSKAVEWLRGSLAEAVNVIVEDGAVRVAHTTPPRRLGERSYGQHTTYEASGEELEVLKLTVEQVAA